MAAQNSPTPWPRPAAVSCPVCPRGEVPADTETCPNCGTDLRPLVRIRRLEHALGARGAAPAPSTLASRPRPGALLLAFAAGALAGTVAGRGMRTATVAAPLSTVGPAASAPANGNRTRQVVAPASEAGRRALVSELQTLAGVSVRAVDDRLRIAFSSELFPLGADDPSPEGSRVLAEVARRLPRAARVTIRGGTDDRRVRAHGRWPDNRVLALARAATAASIVLEAAGHLELTLADGGTGPDAGEPMAPGRTVVLTVDLARAGGVATAGD